MAAEKEFKIMLSQEERDLLKVAMLQALESTRRAGGKAKLQLVRDAYARQEQIMTALHSKINGAL